MVQSYVSPKAKTMKSQIEGAGLFAIEEIKKGEIVAIKGGHVMGLKQRREVENEIEDSYIQIDHDYWIGALTNSEVQGNKMFINHSCEPNVGIIGQISFVAMRDIRKGEELTYDWAMEMDDGEGTWRFECKCNRPSCRKTLTSEDWKNKELHERYGDYFSAYILTKIRQ